MPFSTDDVNWIRRPIKVRQTANTSQAMTWGKRNRSPIIVLSPRNASRNNLDAAVMAVKDKKSAPEVRNHGTLSRSMMANKIRVAKRIS